MQSSNTIPENLKQLQIEFAPVIIKIRDTLSISLNCNGQQLDNLGQVNMLMNDTHISRLVASINALATKVITESSLTPETLTNSMEDLRYALYAYLAGYTELCNRSFPDGYKEGHRLTVAVYKRPLEQILELFENIIMSISLYGTAQAPSASNKINLYVKLNNDTEVARHTEWADKVLHKLEIRKNSYPKPKLSKTLLLSSIVAFGLFGHHKTK